MPIFKIECTNFPCRASGTRAKEIEAVSPDEALIMNPNCVKCGSPMQIKKATREKRG